MAGGGGESNADNPLPLNVVPLIDVIFCLLLFFMCSFHFKTLEGKVEAWLPKDRGICSIGRPATADEIRIALTRDPLTGRAVRKFGRTEYADDTELAKLMRDQYDRNVEAGHAQTPVVIAPSQDVAWEDVMRVMDLTRLESLPRVEFTLAPSEFKIPDVK